jgi:uncharacterized linocin/CFP29 family protein
MRVDVYPTPAARKVSVVADYSSIFELNSSLVITIAFETSHTHAHTLTTAVATLSTTQQPPTTAVTAVAAFTSPHLCHNTAQLHVTYIH